MNPPLTEQSSVVTKPDGPSGNPRLRGSGQSRAATTLPVDDASGPLPRAGQRLAANAAASGAANVLKIGIQLVMLPLMARLLGPDEYGLYTLVLPTVVFFTSLADGGLGTALAREHEQSRAVWSTAFWLLLGVGLLLAGTVVLWGFALGTLSHQPRVAGLMGFMAISVPLITSSVLPSARLTRQGRLAVLAGADLVAALAGAALAVGLAVEGFGVWALSAQYVGGFVVRALILNATAFVPPARNLDLAALRPHIATGASLISGRLAEFAGRLVENLVFGRVFGVALLGSYAFANQASKFMCEAASGPTWGALYTVALRGEPARTALVHRQLATVLGVVVLPMALLVTAAAPELIPLVLGARWAPAAALIQIVIPAYAVTVVATQCTALLLVAGENWLLFWLAGGTVALRIAAVSAGAWVSPIAVAAGLAVAQIVSSVAMLVATRRCLGPELALPLSALQVPFLSGCVGGLVCFGLLRVSVASPVWVLLALGAGAGVNVMTFAVIDAPRLAGGWRQIRNLIR